MEEGTIAGGRAREGVGSMAGGGAVEGEGSIAGGQRLSNSRRQRSGR